MDDLFDNSISLLRGYFCKYPTKPKKKDFIQALVYIHRFAHYSFFPLLFDLVNQNLDLKKYSFTLIPWPDRDIDGLIGEEITLDFTPNGIDVFFHYFQYSITPNRYDIGTFALNHSYYKRILIKRRKN